jgi:hypothetical protein
VEDFDIETSHTPISARIGDEVATPNMTVAVIEGADHGFNHNDGPTASNNAVGQAIKNLAVWLDATD